MKKLWKQAWSAVMAAQQRRAQAHVLAHLDAHTLRDIGLESWNPELAQRVERMRRQDTLVWRAGLGFGALR
jgi:hypothetical protein